VLIEHVPIDDTFAEAFPMTAARLVITAATSDWPGRPPARRPATPRASSVATPRLGSSASGCRRDADGRPGVSVLHSPLAATPCKKPPSTASPVRSHLCDYRCYNGPALVKDKTIKVGGNLRSSATAGNSASSWRAALWRVLFAARSRLDNHPLT